MQNQTSFVSLIWQAATLVLLFSLIVLAVLFLSAPAIAQSLAPAPYKLSVHHNASERGVISPGCAAIVEITGREFGVESFQVVQNPLPYDLAGVTVTIDGKQAAIRLVSPTKLAIIAPDVTFPSRMRRLAWFKVVVATPSDTFIGWAAYAPTAPGLYEQTSGKTRHVQGVYQESSTIIRPFDGGAIPAGVRVVLFGSGMRDAKQLRVWIDDGEELWILPAVLAVDVAPHGGLAGWAGFPWIEGVAFDLPKEAKGPVVLVVQADLMWSQEAWLTVF